MLAVCLAAGCALLFNVLGLGIPLGLLTATGWFWIHAVASARAGHAR